VPHESLLVVLSAGGSPLDADSLSELSGVVVTWLREEREAEAACLAACVRHEDPPGEFRDRVRRWGRARGWAVTVAPYRHRC